MNRRLPALMAGCLSFLLLTASCAMARGGEKAQPAEKPAPNAPGNEKSKPAEKPTPDAPGNDVLNVGDRVKVVYIDVQVSPAELQIPESGELTLHLGHKFMFKGKRRDTLEQEIRNYYIDNGLYRNIGVTIEVPARPLSVGGEVRSPGNYPHTGPLTVLKAIDMAGGFTEYAKKRGVQILRNGKTLTVNCIKALKDPAKYDMPVYPGDKINVPRSIL